MKPMSDVELNKLKQLHELLPLFNFIIDIFQIDKENIALSIQELNNFKNYHSELNKLSNDQQLLLEIIIAVRIMNLEAYRCYFNEKSCETIDLYIKSHEMIEFYLESEDFENFKFKWNKDFLFQIILYFLKGFSYLLKGNGALFLSGAKECMNFSEDYFNKTNRAIDELKKECENHEENKILQEKLELFRKICDALISCIILLKYSRDIELCPISDIERYKYQSLIEKIDETSKKFIFANLKTWSEYNRSVAFKIWSKFLIKKIDYKYILIKINDYNELLEYLSDIYNLCKDGSVISRRIYETLSIIDDKAEIERFGAWEKYYELFSQIIKGEIEVLKIEIQVRDERKTLKKDFEIFEYRHEKIQDNESLKNINNKIKECFEHFKKSSNQNNNSPKSLNQRIEYLRFINYFYVSDMPLNLNFCLQEIKLSDIKESQKIDIKKLIDDVIYSFLSISFKNFFIVEKVFNHILFVLSKINIIEFNEYKKFLKFIINFKSAYCQSAPKEAKQLHDEFLMRQRFKFDKFQEISTYFLLFAQGRLEGIKSEFTPDYDTKITYLDNSSKIYKDLTNKLKSLILNIKKEEYNLKVNLFNYFLNVTESSFYVHQGWKYFYEFMKNGTRYKGGKVPLKKSIEFFELATKTFLKLDYSKRYIIYYSRIKLFQGFLAYFESKDLSSSINTILKALSTSKKNFNEARIGFYLMGIEKYHQYCHALIPLINIDIKLYSIINDIKANIESLEKKGENDSNVPFNDKLNKNIKQAQNAISEEFSNCTSVVRKIKELLEKNTEKSIENQNLAYKILFDLNELNQQNYKSITITTKEFQKKFLIKLQELSKNFSINGQTERSSFLLDFHEFIKHWIPRINFWEGIRNNDPNKIKTEFENIIKIIFETIKSIDNRKEKHDYELVLKIYMFNTLLIYAIEKKSQDILNEVINNYKNFIKTCESEIKIRTDFKNFLDSIKTKESLDITKKISEFIDNNKESIQNIKNFNKYIDTIKTGGLNADFIFENQKELDRINSITHHFHFLQEKVFNSTSINENIQDQIKVESLSELLKLFIILFPIPPLTFGFESRLVPELSIIPIFQEFSLEQKYYQILINFQPNEFRGNYDLTNIYVTNEDCIRYRILDVEHSEFPNFKEIKNFHWRASINKGFNELKWPRLTLIKMKLPKLRDLIDLELIIRVENIEDPNNIIIWRGNAKIYNRARPDPKLLEKIYANIDALSIYLPSGNSILDFNINGLKDLSLTAPLIRSLYLTIGYEIWKNIKLYEKKTSSLEENMFQIALEFLHKKELKNYSIISYNPPLDIIEPIIRKIEDIEEFKDFAIPLLLFFFHDIELNEIKEPLLLICRDFYRNVLVDQNLIEITNNPNVRLENHHSLYRHLYLDYAMPHIISDHSRTDSLSYQESKEREFINRLIQLEIDKKNYFFIKDILNSAILKIENEGHISNMIIELKEKGLIFPINNEIINYLDNTISICH